MNVALIISPDYASHYFPLSTVGRALAERGYQVTVATGPALERSVWRDGFAYRRLVLGPGSNPGLIREDGQPPGEDENLAAFFEASRRGMVPTLLYQARRRLHDLLWQPDQVMSRLGGLLGRLQPSVVICDQLSYSATAALRALQQPYVGFLPGHPSAVALDVAYGYPPSHPGRLTAADWDLAELHEVCRSVAEQFTARFNEAVARHNPNVSGVEDAFAATSGMLTLVNYPGVLGRSYRLPADCRFIGSAVRPVELPARLREVVTSRARPRVYASLGSFFSTRRDILQKLVDSFRRLPVDLILATGVTPPGELGSLPESWVVEPYLPQPALLPHCDLVVTHGGNNTVTEALTAGKPLLVGPLSTDQFAGAADIERAGLGLAFDPNHDDPGSIADLAERVLGGSAVDESRRLGKELRANPGPELAADLITRRGTVTARTA
ncbi:MAG TPA: glycosyltransferase [Acidimicrobiia bacterium]|nr:glycosyltransferase [Acidimicrobiia bacterium]